MNEAPPPLHSCEVLPQVGEPDFVHSVVTSRGRWIIFRVFSFQPRGRNDPCTLIPGMVQSDRWGKARCGAAVSEAQIHPARGTRLPAHPGRRPVFSKDFRTSHRSKKNGIFKRVSSRLSYNESVSSRFFCLFHCELFTFLLMFTLLGYVSFFLIVGCSLYIKFTIILFYQ